MIDPRTRLRAGIDTRLGVEVTTKLGAVLCIMPVMVTANDILAGKILPWHIDTIELRDGWALADLLKTEPTFDAAIIGRVCLAAVLASYDMAEDELAEWFAPEDGEAVLRVCSAACGRSNGNRALAHMRRKALNAALLGLGDASLTAIELAFASDWSVNTQQAPKG